MASAIVLRVTLVTASLIGLSLNVFAQSGLDFCAPEVTTLDPLAEITAAASAPAEAFQDRELVRKQNYLASVDQFLKDLWSEIEKAENKPDSLVRHTIRLVEALRDGRIISVAESQAIYQEIKQMVELSKTQSWTKILTQERQNHWKKIFDDAYTARRNQEKKVASLVEENTILDQSAVEAPILEMLLAAYDRMLTANEDMRIVLIEALVEQGISEALVDKLSDLASRKIPPLEMLDELARLTSLPKEWIDKQQQLQEAVQLVTTTVHDIVGTTDDHALEIKLASLSPAIRRVAKSYRGFLKTLALRQKTNQSIKLDELLNDIAEKRYSLSDLRHFISAYASIQSAAEDATPDSLSLTIAKPSVTPFEQSLQLLTMWAKQQLAEERLLWKQLPLVSQKLQSIQGADAKAQNERAEVIQNLTRSEIALTDSEEENEALLSKSAEKSMIAWAQSDLRKTPMATIVELAMNHASLEATERNFFRGQDKTDQTSNSVPRIMQPYDKVFEAYKRDLESWQKALLLSDDVMAARFDYLYTTLQENYIRGPWMEHVYKTFHIRPVEPFSESLVRFQEHASMLFKASFADSRLTPAMRAWMNSEFARIMVEQRAWEFYSKEGISENPFGPIGKAEVDFEDLKKHVEALEKQGQAFRSKEAVFEPFMFDTAMAEGMAGAAEKIFKAYILQNSQINETMAFQHPAAKVLGEDGAFNVAAHTLLARLEKYHQDIVTNDVEIARLATKAGFVKGKLPDHDEQAGRQKKMIEWLEAQVKHTISRYPKIAAQWNAIKHRHQSVQRQRLLKYAFGGYDIPGLERVGDFSCESYPNVCDGFDIPDLMTVASEAYGSRVKPVEEEVGRIAQWRGDVLGEQWYGRVTAAIKERKPLPEFPTTGGDDLLRMADVFDTPGVAHSGKQLIAEMRNIQVKARRAHPAFSPLLNDKVWNGLSSEERASKQELRDASNMAMSQLIDKEDRLFMESFKRSVVHHFVEESLRDFKRHNTAATADNFMSRAYAQKIVSDTAGQGLMTRDEFVTLLIAHQVYEVEVLATDQMEATLKAFEMVSLGFGLTQEDGTRSNEKLYSEQFELLSLMQALHWFDQGAKVETPFSSPSSWPPERKEDLRKRWSRMTKSELASFKEALIALANHTQNQVLPQASEVYAEFKAPMPSQLETHLQEQMTKLKASVAIAEGYGFQNGQWQRAHGLADAQLKAFAKERALVMGEESALISLEDYMGDDPIRYLRDTLIRNQGEIYVADYLAHVQKDLALRNDVTSANLGLGNGRPERQTGKILDDSLDLNDETRGDRRRLRSAIADYAKKYPTYTYGRGHQDLLTYWKDSVKYMRRNQIEQIEAMVVEQARSMEGLSVVEDLYTPWVQPIAGMTEAVILGIEARRSLLESLDKAIFGERHISKNDSPQERRQRIRTENLSDDRLNIVRDFFNHDLRTLGFKGSRSILGSDKEFVEGNTALQTFNVISQTPVHPYVLAAYVAGPAIGNALQMPLQGLRHGARWWTDHENIDQYNAAKDIVGSEEFYIDNALIGLVNVGAFALQKRALPQMTARSFAVNSMGFNFAMSATGSVGARWSEYDKKHKNDSDDAYSKRAGAFSYVWNLNGDELARLASETIEGMAGSALFVGMNMNLNKRLSHIHSRMLQDPTYASQPMNRRVWGNLMPKDIRASLAGTGGLSSRNIRSWKDHKMPYTQGAINQSRLENFQSKLKKAADVRTQVIDVMEGAPDFVSALNQALEFESVGDVFSLTAAGMDLMDAGNLIRVSNNRTVGDVMKGWANTSPIKDINDAGTRATDYLKMLVAESRARNAARRNRSGAPRPAQSTPGSTSSSDDSGVPPRLDSR